MLKKFLISLNSLYEILEFIENQASICNLSKKSIHNLHIAVEEAFSNVVHYSGLENDSFLSIECSSDDSAFKVTMKDEGIACNPLEYMVKPSLNNSDCKLGGNGIYLMWKLTDHLEYKREGNSNILTLTILKK